MQDKPTAIFFGTDILAIVIESGSLGSAPS